MADPGTALAVASLSFQVFAGCIKGFALVTDAVNLQRDAAVERTKLLIQEQRLIEWAKAVRLVEPQSTVVSWLNQAPAAIILGQLYALLGSAKNLKDRYGIQYRSPSDDDLRLAEQYGLSPEDASPTTALSPVVQPSVRQRILRHITGAEAPKRAWWAAFDKGRYLHLVDDVTSYVDGLWALLTPELQIQSRQAINEILREIIQVKESVNSLRELRSSIQPSANQRLDTELPQSLAASAGIRAVKIERNLSQASDGMSAAGSFAIRSSDISNTTPSSSTSAIGIGKWKGQGGTSEEAITVILEEKRAEDSRVKSKLRKRVADLVTLLAEPPTPDFRVLKCLGYTEEPMAFRMLFEPPRGLAPQLVRPPQTLYEMLHGPTDAAEPLPTVGHRLALASKICGTVLSFHSAEWLHKDIRSCNIMMFSSQDRHAPEPYLGGFSFSRRDVQSEISEEPGSTWQEDIYRHPDAQDAARSEGVSFQRHMDAYSLGCLLVELADWVPLRRILKSHVDFAKLEKSSALTPAHILGIKEWLVQRYLVEGRAGFRLGRGFQQMLAICLMGTEQDDRNQAMQKLYKALAEMSSL